MSTADAIRGYVVTLRREQGITIERAAKAAGLEKRAYISNGHRRTQVDNTTAPHPPVPCHKLRGARRQALA